MTLPTDIVLPMDMDLVRAGDPQSLELYLRNMTETLTQMYSDIVQNVNGAIRQWTPTLRGSTTAGTVTYTSQIGWLVRTGIFTDLWFDVSWTAHNGTGNLNLVLPYQVAASEGFPWVGPVETDGLSYTGGRTYVVLTAEQNSFVASLTQCGSGLTSSSMPVRASGRIAGHLRYIGKENES